MCTLAGVFRFRGERCTAEDFQAICDGLVDMHNRGPDEQFVERVDESCILGGNRLAIRNREAATMPFRSDGIIASFNGEIYGGSSDDGLDGRAIIPAFREHGTRLGRYLDGEFSISLWNSNDSEVVLIRDHFGTKPLYFGFDCNKLVWGSSSRWVASLLKRPACPPVIGPAYKHTFCSQEPYSSFKGVWSVPPGHSLTVRKNQLELEACPGWPLDILQKYSFEDALWHSLRTRLKNYDGTIAIPMSAGIDSGILAFAAKLLGIDFHVFSLVEIFGNKTDEAEFICRRIDKLKPIQATLLSLSDDDFESALSALFSPSCFDSITLDNGAILTHHVARAVSDAGIRVMIDGAGGDELFDGYLFRKDLLLPPGWPRLPRDDLSSIFTTLPAYTAKADRCGGSHSIEVRFPFQTHRLLSAAVASRHEPGKGLLRRFLFERLDYGKPLAPDIDGKFGFSMRGHDLRFIRGRMFSRWESEHGRYIKGVRQDLFPFNIGVGTVLSI